MGRVVSGRGILSLGCGLLLWTAGLAHASPSTPPEARRQPVLNRYGKLPLRFEANQGQAAPEVLFLSRGRGYTLFLTLGEAVLALRSDVNGGAVVRLRLLGTNPEPAIRGEGKLPGKSHYFIGNDPDKWRTNIPTYARVRYENIYPGIDLIYYGTEQGQLEYDFIVRPGADPGAIRFEVDGAETLRLDEDGNVVIGLSAGQVVLRAPAIYQEDKGEQGAVPGGYLLLAENRVGFHLGDYDARRPLVIDPVLSYSTFLGDLPGDTGNGVAVDTAGNAYIVGTTINPSFPATAGAFDTTCGGDGTCDFDSFSSTVHSDAYVAKLNATGTNLVYATFLGGSPTPVPLGKDRGLAIAVDAAGNAYLTGTTNSLDFPLTPGAFDTTCACGGNFFDVFFTKLNPTGSALVYSTYVGGVGQGGEPRGIAVDPAGSAYLTGVTASGFPHDPTLVQPACSERLAIDTGTGIIFAGFTDGFVAKLNPDGDGPADLAYSTCLGGNDEDEANGIAVDAAGNAYVTGGTNSRGPLDASDPHVPFPTTPGAFDTTCDIACSTLNNDGTEGDDWSDAFVVKLNPDGSLAYGSFLGTQGPEKGNAIGLDATGNVYLGGSSAITPPSDTSFPPSGVPGWDLDCGEAAGCIGPSGIFPDGFVAKMNLAGNGQADLLYFTFLGGDSEDEVLGIALDAAANAYVTGKTASANFPVSSDALQDTLGGGSDAFLAAFSPAGTALLSSTYFGGTGPAAESGKAIAVDSTAAAYVTGEAEVPTTEGAFEERGSGPFVAQFTGVAIGANPVPSIAAVLPAGVTPGSPGFDLTVSGTFFSSNAVIRSDGVDRSTVFVNSTELRTPVLASEVSTTKTINVNVVNPSPGGGATKAIPFEVTLRFPVPTVTELTPPGAVGGSGNFTLTVIGNNFAFGAEVQWNGSPRPTTFVSKTQLQAAIEAADIIGPGPTTATVTVVNPTPGGGTSNDKTFFITTAPNPLPSISSLSPPLPIAGVRGGSTLTVSGNDFAPGAVVLWDGSARPTVFDDPTQVRASLLDIDTARAGTVQVMVANPEPGGGLSAPFAYDILNPLPGQPALFPSDLPAGSPGFLLTATGANYVPESLIRWNGLDRPTTFVSSTQLRAFIDAADLATAGAADVTVFNPLPGGGESPAGTFTINAAPNPTPAITSLTPNSAPAGRTGFLLTVDGSNFVPGSVVRWNGADRFTTFVSNTQLVAVISDADVAASGSVPVTVFNPAPDGGESNSVLFTVTTSAMAVTESDSLAGRATASQGAEAPAGSESETRRTGPRSESTAPEVTPGIPRVFASAPNPVPVIEALEPKSVAAGSGELTLVVKGEGFVRGSLVRWNGVIRPTTFVSSTELQADISAADLKRAGTVEVTVFNPTPGGGPSNGSTFTISP